LFCHFDRVTPVRINNKLNVVVLCTTYDLSHESPSSIKRARSVRDLIFRKLSVAHAAVCGARPRMGP
jgi:hypothetical protein